MSAEDLRAGFERAIEADPDNPEPYRVFADWLQSIGDPRGELIALQLALENEPPGERRRELRAANERALAAGEDHLVGYWLYSLGLESIFDSLVAVGDPGPWARTTLSWRFGFVSSIAITQQTVARLGELLELPSARFTRSLELYLQAGTFVLRQLQERRVPRTIRALRIQTGSYRCAIDLRDYDRVFPALSEIAIGGTDVTLPERVTGLRTLRFTPVREAIAQTQALSRRTWADLRELHIHWQLTVGTDRESALRDLFARPIFPALRVLSLEAHSIGTTLAVAAPLLPQLEELHCYGVRHADEVPAALAGAPQLRHLKKLVFRARLDRKSLTNTMIADVRHALGPALEWRSAD